MVFAFLASLLTVKAQMEKPITWSISARMTSETEGVVTIRANISEGWHVYGLQMPENGPMATTFEFNVSDVTFTSDIVPSSEPIVKGEENYWDKPVKFTRNFTVTGESPKIEATVTFMGCNDETCLPPDTSILKVKNIRKYTQK